MSKEQAIARRIQELCQEHGLSINALAAKSHISSTTIRSILQGDDERNTRISTIFNICCGFGMSLREFFESDQFTDQSTKIPPPPAESCAGTPPKGCAF